MNKNNVISTEALILEAAEKEFINKGFAGARTIAIAESAGVTHAMLHYYFRTKKKLFERVISEKISSLTKAFIIGFDYKYSLMDSVRMAVESHFDFVRRNPSLPKFLITTVLADESLMEIMREKIEDVASSVVSSLQKKIDESAARGECKRVDAYTLVLDIISLNVFPMIASGVISKLGSLGNFESYDDFLDARRRENVQTILNKLMN